MLPQRHIRRYCSLLSTGTLGNQPCSSEGDVMPSLPWRGVAMRAWPCEEVEPSASNCGADGEAPMQEDGNTRFARPVTIRLRKGSRDEVVADAGRAGRILTKEWPGADTAKRKVAMEAC